jgi:hypothetical protein
MAIGRFVNKLNKNALPKFKIFDFAAGLAGGRGSSGRYDILETKTARHFRSLFDAVFYPGN